MFRNLGFYKEPSPPLRAELLSKPFNYKSPEQLLLIQEKTDSFKKAQTELYKYDNKILNALGVGLVFYAGASILLFVPSFTISVASFSYASYLLGNRPQRGLVKPYREALNDLIGVYEWALGNKTDTWWKLGLSEIQELILTLGPMVRKEVLVVWEPKDLQPGTLRSRGKEPSALFKSKIAEFAAGTHMQSPWFSIYGAEGNDDILGMVSMYLKEKAQDVAEKYMPSPVVHYLGLRSR